MDLDANDVSMFLLAFSSVFQYTAMVDSQELLLFNIFITWKFFEELHH